MRGRGAPPAIRPEAVSLPEQVFGVARAQEAGFVRCLCGPVQAETHAFDEFLNFGGGCGFVGIAANPVDHVSVPLHAALAVVGEKGTMLAAGQRSQPDHGKGHLLGIASPPMNVTVVAITPRNARTDIADQVHSAGDLGIEMTGLREAVTTSL